MLVPGDPRLQLRGQHLSKGPVSLARRTGSGAAESPLSSPSTGDPAAAWNRRSYAVEETAQVILLNTRANHHSRSLGVGPAIALKTPNMFSNQAATLMSKWQFPGEEPWPDNAALYAATRTGQRNSSSALSINSGSALAAAPMPASRTPRRVVHAASAPCALLATWRSTRNPVPETLSDQERPLTGLSGPASALSWHVRIRLASSTLLETRLISPVPAALKAEAGEINRSRGTPEQAVIIFIRKN